MSNESQIPTFKPELVEPLLIVGYDKVLLWDGEDLQEIIADMGPLYGITWSHDHVFIACDHRIERFTMDVQANGTLWMPGPDPHMHQLLWTDGTLHAVCSGTSKIERWRGEGAFSLLKPLQMPEWVEDGADPHINSIWRGPELWYVVEHWRDKLPKYISTYDHDWTPRERLPFDKWAFVEEYNGLHNVYVEDDVLTTLTPRQIVRWGRKGGAQVSGPVTHEPYYLRGMAVTDRAMYVGMSLYKSVRLDRTSGDGMVWGVDSDAGIVVQRIGQVNDLRAVFGDKAHNGLPCPWARCLGLGK